MNNTIRCTASPKYETIPTIRNIANPVLKIPFKVFCDLLFRLLCACLGLCAASHNLKIISTLIGFSKPKHSIDFSEAWFFSLTASSLFKNQHVFTRSEDLVKTDFHLHPVIYSPLSKSNNAMADT